MINLNHLRVFYQAARHQNFSLAAKSLYITQPAVSAQIKLFEESFNLKLFKKRGRKVYLTDEGQALFEYARKIFEYEREIEDAIEDMKELKRGILRLGTTKTYARYFMPFLISKFREAYPHIKIYLDEGSSLDMTNSLLEFSNELAIIAKIEDNADICFLPFSHEELIVVLPPHHTLAHKKAVSISELAEEPVIMKEKGSGTRKLVGDLFRREDLIPDILMETSNTEFIKELVQRGDGIAFLVKETVIRELMEKKLAAVPIKDAGAFLDVNIAYLKNQHLSPPAQAFLNMLLKITQEEGPDLGIRNIMADMLAHWK
ncbi:MAG: LysR family transcriptional regulator [Deltaproteobacteria bacterium]|nr:LysR family transcriptional regulator [Deltaproteobacteria bacterium]RLB28863.1 MAG: LysR family transcriptional regulator [Deltaproteobacteria bacterium]